MFYRVSALCVLIVGILLWAGPVSASEQRIALVIGNGAYDKGALRSPAQDVVQISRRLESSGFDVLVEQDVSFYDLRILVEEFANMAEEAELALFYYAGHALRLRAVSYLVPVDVNLRNRGDLQKLTWLDEVISAGTQAGNFIGILDTCRVSRHAEGWGEKFGRGPVCGANKELGKNLPENAVLAVADTAISENSSVPANSKTSLYARALVEQIKPGLSAMQILENAHFQVRTLSRNRQNPVLLGALDSGIALHQSSSVAQQTRPASQVGTQPTLEKIAAGVYSIQSVDRTRRVFQDESGTLVVGSRNRAAGADRWELLEFPQGYGLRNTSGSRFLSLASGNVNAELADSWVADRTAWGFEAIDNGLNGEKRILHLASGAYLVPDAAGTGLAFSQTPPQSGWLVSPVDENRLPESAQLTIEVLPADSTINMLGLATQYRDGMNLVAGESYQVEVSKEGYESWKGWIKMPNGSRTVKLVLQRADDTALTQPVPETPATSSAGAEAVAPPEAISEVDRLDVLGKLVAVKDAVADTNEQQLQSLLPPSPTRSLFLQLVQQYQDIDIELVSSSSSNASGVISGILRIEKMVLPNGDTVLPADSYKEITLSSKRIRSGVWSRLY